MTTKQVKILSLDGGGSWAILQAMALQATYSGTSVGTNCRNILNQFDVVSANSGGSLMLAAMIEHADDDISKVIEMFLDLKMRESVFSALKTGERSPLEWGMKFMGIGPRYKASRKIDGFLKALPVAGKMEMHRINAERNIRPNIIICGFDYDMLRAVFFISNQGERKDTYRLADAINAASNAPINYFDKPVEFRYDNQSHRFWDGAVGGNNNPVLIGITEALKAFDGCALNPEDMKVLSIGTGNNLIPIRGFTKSDRAQDKKLMKEKDEAKLLNDIPRMSQSIISEPPDAANFMAHMFLGGRNEWGAKPSIIRMNALIQPCLVDDVWTLPQGVDEGIFYKLIKLDMDAVKQDEVEMIRQLGDWWMAGKISNQGIRYNGLTFEVSIGHKNFAAARADWLGRCGISTSHV
jgi:uncharacterized protein